MVFLIPSTYSILPLVGLILVTLYYLPQGFSILLKMSGSKLLIILSCTICHLKKGYYDVFMFLFTASIYKA